MKRIISLLLSSFFCFLLLQTVIAPVQAAYCTGTYTCWTSDGLSQQCNDHHTETCGAAGNYYGSCLYADCCANSGNSCVYHPSSDPTPTPGGGGGTTPTSYNPIGYHDPPTGVCVVRGWACDQDSWSTAVDIDFYHDTLAPANGIAGGIKANLVRSDDSAIAALCGGTGGHGFSYQLPETYWDGYNHTILAYAISVDSSGTRNSGSTLLPESVVGNRITNCCPATTAPTGLSPSGSITAGTRNITWNTVAGAVSYTLTVTPSTGQANSYSITGTSQSYTFVAGVTYTLTVRANFRGVCGSSNTATTTVSVPQSTITLSGRYLSSPTCNATGATQVSLVSGSSYPSLSWSYPLGNQSLTNTTNSYSLNIVRPSSLTTQGTLGVTIPTSAPYVCCNGTAYNSKVCSYSVSVSSSSGNLTQDILVAPAVTVMGNIFETTTSQPGNVCNLGVGTQPSLLTAANRVYLLRSGTTIANSMISSSGSYSFSNVRTDWTYNLQLNASTTDNRYSCACPSPVGSNLSLCQYSNVSFSAETPSRNFYLIDTRMASTAWFQIFGGNAFATGSIHSIVPTACNSATSCADALMASVSSNSLSSGFPVSQATDTNSIQTTNDALSYHSYIHQTPSDGGRADNANNNSYQVGSQIQLASYQELLAKLTVVPEERTESTLDLASWRSASFWGSEDTHFIRVTAPEVLLTDQSHFTLTPGEKILVIVNGNLSIRNTGASNTKITQVPEGAFLGFIVSGNITIENSVGADISLSDPSALPATRDNAQLSGVFYANEQLIVEAYSDPPDRKLIAAGTFVGRQAVDLQRRFEADGTNNAILNSYQAVENFIFRPDFVANWPQGLRIAATNWRQINPRYVPAE